MKPINSAYLSNVSGPEDYSPRQNRPVNLHFNRKLLFRSAFTLNFTNNDKPIYRLEVADVVLKYRTLLRLITFTFAVMSVTIVIKCFTYL